ncbi:MAG: trypsin-like peptidase domain-containing protein, partial [Planctomycetota bacterium]
MSRTIRGLLCLFLVAVLARCDSSSREPAPSPPPRKPAKPRAQTGALEKVGKATVFIQAWYRPVGEPGAGQPLSSGSGFVVRSDGVILTGARVVASVLETGASARDRKVYVLQRVTVRFGGGTKDGRVVPAQVLCTRPDADLALLRVPAAEP